MESPRKPPSNGSHSPGETCTRETSACDTAQANALVTSPRTLAGGRGDDGDAKLPDGQFFEFRAYRDGSTNFSFDPRTEQQPGTAKDISAIQGQFTLSIWQLLWWCDSKLQALKTRDSMLTEALARVPTKGEH